MNRGRRILTAVAVVAALSLGGAIAASAGGETAGEAPDNAQSEIVVGESTYVDERTLGRQEKIDRALSSGEPSLGNGTLARAVRDAGLDEHHLVEIRDDKDAGGEPREDALFLVEDGSVLEVWWQGIDSDWGLTSGELVSIPGGSEVPTQIGESAQIRADGELTHMMVTDGSVLVSVLSSSRNGGQALSDNEVTKLLTDIFVSVSAER